MNSKGVIVCLFLTVFVALAFTSSLEGQPDYFGRLDYLLPNVTYYFYINQSSSTITFAGLNETNSNHYLQIPFISNDFKMRINYVWYHGWADDKNLYVDEFVPAGIYYTSNSSQLSNNTYFSQFLLEEIPFTNVVNVTANVTINSDTGKSLIEFNEYPFNSTENNLILNDTRVAAHIFLPMLLETRFSQNSNNIELHLWVKGDYNGINLTPHWTSELHTLDEEAINLVNPVDNALFQINGTEIPINFDFSVNGSYFEKEIPSCLVSVNGANGTTEIKASLNETTLIGTVSGTFGLGNYDWRVWCKDSLKYIRSENREFRIEQLIPMVEEEEVVVEEEGRRRKVITLNATNLSQNIQTDEDNFNPISLITGAVIGLVGETGTFIIGLVLIVVGLLALVVYNREHLGLVKKE